ncbi:MAG TPA: hypothetical protein VJ925_06420 [Longimicrobiales bacterium]|nr:hypothetical protein [Longimicrobiales bacterium]
MMRPSLGLASLTAGTLTVAAAYIAVLLPGPAPAWPAWSVALGTCLLLFGFLDLGAGRRDGRPLAVRLVFAGTAIWVAVGFLGILWSTPADLETPFVWGLPLPAAWMIYVLGIGPALFLPLAWVVLFRSATLPDDALDRLRAAKRAHEAAGEDTP